MAQADQEVHENTADVQLSWCVLGLGMSNFLADC